MKRRNFLKLSSLAAGGALLHGQTAIAGIGTFSHIAFSSRKVAIDIETTGFDPGRGDRILEIAAVEIAGRMVTQNRFHGYCHPEHDLAPEAAAGDELVPKFLTARPKVGEVLDRLTQFIGDAPLVIHYAPFVLRFLDAELERLGREPVFRTWPRVANTLQMARAKGQKLICLHDLCAHYGIPSNQSLGAPGIETAEAVARFYLAMTSDMV